MADARDDETTRELAHKFCCGTRMDIPHHDLCGPLGAFIASALRDARAEGRREMREEAAAIADRWQERSQRVDDGSPHEYAHGWRQCSAVIRDAIRALPIATQATPVCEPGWAGETTRICCECNYMWPDGGREQHRDDCSSGTDAREETSKP